MRQINVRQAKPGLITGREVIDEKGQVLLHRHVPLSTSYIEALVNKGFTRIWVIDPEEEPIVDLEDDIPPEVRTEAHLALRKAFEEIEKEVGKLQGDNMQQIIQSFSSENVKALLGSDGPLGQVIEAAQSIMRSVLSRVTLAGLSSIKSKDNFLYEHSVDVCAVALMVGRAAGLKTDRLRQLAAGCLLHDIGKIFLEEGVSGDKEIYQHTTLGYELLRASEEKDILTPHVAYEHHERPDKQGLPRGLRAGNYIMRDRTQPPPIPTALGEIAAVANAYDRLLSGGHGRPSCRPDEALKYIVDGAGEAYNHEVVQILLRVVPLFPLGTEVVVRSERYRNHVGVVTRVNVNQLDRPVVTLVRDGRGQRMRHTPIDLAAEPDIQIRSK